ncbi:MAG: hypothetical protein ABI197_11840 [Granulicella sp.]
MSWRHIGTGINLYEQTVAVYMQTCMVLALARDDGQLATPVTIEYFPTKGIFNHRPLMIVKYFRSRNDGLKLDVTDIVSHTELGEHDGGLCVRDESLGTIATQDANITEQIFLGNGSRIHSNLPVEKALTPWHTNMLHRPCVENRTPELGAKISRPNSSPCVMPVSTGTPKIEARLINPELERTTGGTTCPVS